VVARRREVPAEVPVTRKPIDPLLKK
jgi:hypothetical protein